MEGSARDPRMDRLDYRPDMYGLVEGPPGVPQHIIDHALKISCPDCLVNVFIEPSDTDPTGYHIQIAHDDLCPWLSNRERAERER